MLYLCYVNGKFCYFLFRKPIATQEAPTPKNFFSNDGSFFENFKRITEAVRKTQPEALPKSLIEEEAKEPPPPEIEEELQPPPPEEQEPYGKGLK